MIRASLLIAHNDLRRRVRDRSIWLLAFVAPLGLALIIGAAFGRNVEISPVIGVVDAEGSVVGSEIVGSLEAEFGTDGDADPIKVVRVASQADAEMAIESGEIDAAIVVNRGSGVPVNLVVIVDAANSMTGGVATAIARSVAANVDERRLASASNSELLIAEAEVLDTYDPVAYFAPSMAILFMFLTLGSGARSLIVERDDGTLVRLRSMPIPPAAILVGKTLGVIVVGLMSIAVMWLVTMAIFDASWGDPAAVGVVSVATVVAVAGIALSITGLARTDTQADGLVAMVAFVLALLGGNFIGPGLMPDGLRHLALFTPNGWALRAFTEIGAGAAGAVDVLPAVGVLVGMGVITGAVGLIGMQSKLANLSRVTR